MAATTAPPIKAIFLDFDSTISTPIFIKRANCWAIAINKALFETMSQEEIVANFGGPQRIATMHELFTALKVAGVTLHIISIGVKALIVPHLRAVGLLQHFDEALIWGQDCKDLRSCNFVKGLLIAKIMKA